MRISNKFIFTCLIAVILFVPIFLKNVSAAHEESVKHSANSVKHGEETAEKDLKTLIEGHEEESTPQSGEIVEHGEEHGSSHLWPHYGKMLIFAQIVFAFMLFSFIAPLTYFYIKGEKHH